MRHKGVNKEETRQKILEAVGRGFRQNGYAGIGVDGLAKDAGVTSGAFYSHFGSKDGAFEAALSAGLDEVIERIPQVQREQGTDWVKVFADYYLGRQHRSDLACGCAMATLTPEVARSGKDFQGIYEKKMTRIVELIAAGLAGNSKGERHTRAWSLLGTLVGGLNVARALKSARLGDEVADAIKTAAVKVAGRTRAINQD